METMQYFWYIHGCPMVSAAASLVISWYKTNGISYTAGDIEDVILSAAKKQIALECVVQKGDP